ncbi:MAG: XRE family transcriptional regulator [Anaerovoracaceae bacterium]
MQKKSTTNLEKNLKEYDSVNKYLKDNKNELTTETLEFQLQEMIEKKGLNRAKVIKESNLNQVYGYQILSGTRKPSRDKLLCICFGMKTTMVETQSILKQNGYPPLYARNHRDSIIIFAIEHERTVFELNYDLYDNGEAVLQ